MMARPLPVLIVEDSEDDALLLVRELTRAGFAPQWHRVETADAFVAALGEREWDVVLSDYTLPSFSAPTALQLLHASGLDLPFIIVSGTVGEETAVAAMKAGAHDFMLKSSLARLAPAIERELRDAEGRRQRRAAEEALHASEARYRELFERNLAGVFRATADGRLLDCNDAFARIFGFSCREEALLHSTTELYRHPTDREALLEALRLAGTVVNFEAEGRRPDGQSVWVLLNATLADDAIGTIVEGTIVDITQRHRAEEELRRTQDQLLQAQKMEAVGRLAGGIAHDFNNLLQAMLGAIQVLEMRYPGEGAVGAVVNELSALVKRAAALTRQLLVFARRDMPHPEKLDLNEVVRSAAGFLRRLVRANIRFNIKTSDAPLLLRADPGQLEQVLTNLVVNAVDAMPEGGELTIRTGMRDDKVWFEVRDTGSGIDAAVAERLFEPFFTTKEAGKGTGLGLSVVHGIVSQHGGRVELSSRPGHGATFRVTLPGSESGGHPKVEEGVATGEPAGGGERILVVEDDAALRGPFREILTALGYAVTLVASAEEAEALPAGQPFDLLLSDHMLPGRSGGELAVRLHERWPAMRVVLMSGYAADDVLRKDVRSGAVRFLQKPVDIDTLAREVRAALDQR